MADKVSITYNQTILAFSVSETMNKIRQNSLNLQRGVSKFGIMMLLIVISTFLTVGLKIGPLYVDHNLITGICQDIVDNGEAQNMTVRDVRARVSNSLRINNILDFDLSNITLQKRDGVATITVAYERRVELFANLDAVAKFDTVLE